MRNTWRIIVGAWRRAMGGTPLDARTFEPSAAGSGVFGEWTLDTFGLPAYRYTLDQWNDSRARYPNTENQNRRDHWHQLGNDRITALVSNDGVVQLFIGDRGGVFLNRFEARDREGLPDPPAPALTFGQKLAEFAAHVLYALARFWHALRAAGIHRVRHDPVIPRGVPTQAVPPQTQSRTRLAIVVPHTYAGGFGYVDDGVEVWATAYRYRRPGVDITRLFGIGHCDTAATYRNIRVTRRVYAPPGDDAIVLNDVAIENLSADVAHLRYYEYWDVNMQRLKLQWLRSGPFAASGDEARRALNDDFTSSVTMDEQMQAVRFQQQPRAGTDHDAGAVADTDTQPLDVFLASLTNQRVVAVYTNKAAFFGQGGAVQPDAVAARSAFVNSVPSPDESMPYCLVLRHDIELQPGAKVDLRYAFGAARPDDNLAFLGQHNGNTLAKSMAVWKNRLAYFNAANEPVLQREMAWHAHNLLAATLRYDYYNAHMTPQGSAYLYLHGADGAPRDQSLCILPLTYLRPELAREELIQLMSLTHAAGGNLPYAYCGNGYHSDALGLHTTPTDLDLFLLLALNEYLAATGDQSFLDASLPYYPRGQRPPAPYTDSVFDHIRITVRHLIDAIGLGEHDLIRIGDGDWSDSIVIENALRELDVGVNLENTRRGGESAPNSQMALYVLPRIARLLEQRDAELAAEVRTHTARLEKAVMLQWNGRWFARAILRDIDNRPAPIADDWLNLEAQPWALISGITERMGKQDVQARLIDCIRRLLDDPSPVGAPINERGLVWPAISQLLTWGYRNSRPDLAWRSLKRNTFAAHSEVFPHIWYGIWSGPDGMYSVDAPNAGYTWASPVTPMTDFPVMNANPDAMALLGTLRVCGIEPSPDGDGLLINPQSPPERFELDLPLLCLSVRPGYISGEYRAAIDGHTVLHIRLPHKAQWVSAVAGGQPVMHKADSDITLPLSFARGQTILFEFVYS